MLPCVCRHPKSQTKEQLYVCHTIHPDLKMGYMQFQLIGDVLPILLLVYFLVFTSAPVVSGVCVHVYVCLFYSREGWGRGAHQIIHQNKSMANSIFHPECPVWPCMTPEHTVQSTPGASEERAHGVIAESWEKRLMVQSCAGNAMKKS